MDQISMQLTTICDIEEGKVVGIYDKEKNKSEQTA